MKHRSPPFRLGSFLTLSLVAVLMISACASAVTSAPAAPTAAPVSSTAAPSDTTPDTAAAATPTQAAQVQEVVPPSRGPNLEATDPSTVSLASGQLQLIEFFRFT